MNIRSIHLQNYRCYHDEFIELPTGLIGVVGNNGAGKSTIIEAIGWCLYGNKAARTKDKNLIKRTGAEPHDDCKVTIEITMGNDSIKIERELRGASASGLARLFINGDSHAHITGSEDVTKFIERRTGMDRIAFFTSIFAQQKELNGLSGLDAAERKKTVTRLLRIDTIDKVIKQIREDVRLGRTSIDSLKRNLKGLENLKEQAEALAKDNEDKSKEVASAINEESVLKTKVEDSKRLFAVHEKKSQQHNNVEKQLGNKTSSRQEKVKTKDTVDEDLRKAQESETVLKELHPQIQEFKAVEKEKTRLDDLKIEFERGRALEKQLKELEPKIAERQEVNTKNLEKLDGYKNIEKSLKNNQSESKRLSKQKERLNDKTSRLKEKIEQFKDLKATCEEQFSKIKSLGKDSECPTCKRPLGSHLDKVTAHFCKEIDSFNKRIEAKTKERNDVSAEIKIVSGKMEDLSKVEKGIREDVSKRTKLAASLKESTKVLNGMKMELKSLKARLKKYEKIEYDQDLHEQVKAKYRSLKQTNERAIRLKAEVKRIPLLDKRSTKLEKDTRALDSAIGVLKGKLGKIGFDKLEYEKSKKALETANEDYGDKKAAVERLKGEQSNTELLIRQNKEDIVNEEKTLGDIGREEKAVGSRSTLETIMNNFKMDLIARIRPSLSTRASNLLRQITNGRFSTMELNEEYEIQIEDEGKSFGIDRFSGGESDLANLCLRVAISQELSERSGGGAAGFIVLDEIFGSQDSERKVSIMKALSALSNQFKQILLITHIDDVKESLPFVLNVKVGDGEGKIRPEGGAIPV